MTSTTDEPQRHTLGMTDRITVQVNGDPRIVAAHTSVRDLLAELQLDPRTVVVEVNRTIVRRPALEATVLREGDRIELVHFVGGG